MRLGPKCWSLNVYVSTKMCQVKDCLFGDAQHRSTHCRQDVAVELKSRELGMWMLTRIRWPSVTAIKAHTGKVLQFVRQLLISLQLWYPVCSIALKRVGDVGTLQGILTQESVPVLSTIHTKSSRIKEWWDDEYPTSNQVSSYSEID